MDPEFSQGALSLARTNAFLGEIWPYPPSRSFWFSIDLDF
jgi:hypothetical protein